jgi:hypothetical protein
LLLNLTWFLADQIVLVRFIIAAVIVSLYWGDQFLSVIFQMSSIELNWRFRFKKEANQDHRRIANAHWKKMWNEDSDFLQH